MKKILQKRLISTSNKIFIKFKNFIDKILKKFNLKLIKYKNYEKFILNNQNFDLNFINQIKNKEKLFNTMQYLPLSRSQLRQDLFVLNKLDFIKNGFFVEFGAANGINLSNSYLLEKEFNWKGIVAEPAKIFHKELLINRNCHIENKLVWKDSKSQLIFNETFAAEMSTIKQFSDSDFHTRSVNKEYTVETISLNDLLKKYNAPHIIDYLSIDTEGSEFDILNNFDFNSHQFKIITCEHNYSPNKDKIFNLLCNKGYIKVLSNISQFDDWYVKTTII